MNLSPSEWLENIISQLQSTLTKCGGKRSKIVLEEILTAQLGVKVAKAHFAAMRRLKMITRLCFRKKFDFYLEMRI